jgi:hypothetical protein
MRIARSVSTELLPAAGAAGIPRSEILLHGARTGKLVSGAMLEAAVQWQDRHLLFMTDDVPFEDMLSIQLLDARFDLLDSALLGSPYATGSFSSLSLIEPNKVRFRFIGDTFWTVELLAVAQARLPFLSDPPGIRRPLRFYRHFRIYGQPRPEPAGSR